MLSIQDIASVFHDGTIIACSPVVTEVMMEPSRIVIRDLGRTYVVHLQYWPVSGQPSGRVLESVKPYYTSGNYFAKSESGALSRAWYCCYSRYFLLAGSEDHLATLGKVTGCTTRGKASLRTEITTLAQA